jgi:NHL repeat
LQKSAVQGSGDTTADHVIAQSSFAGYLCGDGQDGNPPPSASSLCGPTGIVVDPLGNIFVADSQNNRILEYTTPFNAGMGADTPNANLVFGQRNFTHTRCTSHFALAFPPTSHGLCNPSALALDKENNLYVSDTNNNRVLEYFAPLAQSSVAGSGDTIPDAVLGQSSFVRNVCVGKLGGSKPANASGLCNPMGLSVHSADNLFISDTYNNPVLRFAP